MLIVLSGPLCCVVAHFDGLRVHFHLSSCLPLSFSLSLFYLQSVPCVALRLLSFPLSALSSLFLALTRTTAGGREGVLLHPSPNWAPPAHIGSRGWPWTLPIVPVINYSLGGTRHTTKCSWTPTLQVLIQRVVERHSHRSAAVNF